MSISRTSRVACCLPLAALLLAACGEIVENIPPRPAAIDDPAIADAPYPSLASVPARPQLTYTLEQRREIAVGLVADRANARYAGDTLRQDLDRPVEPDTAPPLPPLPVREPAPAADPEADLALAYVEEALARDSDDGSLGDFLDRLERRPPASAEARPTPPPPAVPVEPAVEPLPLEPVAVEPSPVVEPEPVAVVPEAPMAPEPAPELEMASAAEPALEPDEHEPAPVASMPADLPLAVLFDPNTVDLAESAQAQVRGLAQALSGDGLTIVVSGGGARAGLAMERARRVAALLVSAGVSPERIAIEMGGENDVVVVYEPDV